MISFEVEENGCQIMIQFGDESFNDLFINDEEAQNDNGDSIYDKQIQLPFNRLIYKSDLLEGQTYDDDYKIIIVGVKKKERINPKGHQPFFKRIEFAMDCKILKLIQFEMEFLPNYLSWLLNQDNIFPHNFLNLYLQSILSKLFIKQAVNKRLRYKNVVEILRKIIIRIADVLKQEKKLAVKKLKPLEIKKLKLLFGTFKQQSIKLEQVIILSNFQKSLKKFLKKEKKLIQNADKYVNAIGS